jgi:hypothetical protein
MAGRIKRQLNTIINTISKDNPTLINIVRTKLILKGLNPDKFNELSPDDPAVLEKVKIIAAEFGVKVNAF